MIDLFVICILPLLALELMLVMQFDITILTLRQKRKTVVEWYYDTIHDDAAALIL